MLFKEISLTFTMHQLLNIAHEEVCLSIALKPLEGSIGKSQRIDVISIWAKYILWKEAFKIGAPTREAP